MQCITLVQREFNSYLDNQVWFIFGKENVVNLEFSINICD